MFELGTAMEDYGQSLQYVENESDGELDNRRSSTDVIINQYLPLPNNHQLHDYCVYTSRDLLPFETEDR